MASPAKSIVSQIRPRNKHFSTQHHMRHGLQDMQWIYIGFTLDLRFFARVRIREICHAGNVDILGLDIENSGLNSVILRFSRVQAPISVF